MAAVLAVLFALPQMAAICGSTAAEVYAETATPSPSAEGAVVYAGSTGQIIYEDHSERKLQPGRTSSLMVAMVVMDNMHDEKEMNNEVKITKWMAEAGNTFPVGTRVTVSDLLYALLMTGSPEAARALSYYTAEGEEAFVEQMNAKAQQLGLVDTHYTNVTGAYGTKQYSTALDTAKIFVEAYRYEEIETRAKTKEHVTKTEPAVTIETTSPALTGTIASKGVYGGVANTLSKPSSLTYFAGGAMQDDFDVVVVLLGAGNSTYASDAVQMLAYGFEHANKKTVSKEGVKMGYVRVRGGAKTLVPVYTEGKAYAYIPPDGSEQLVRTEKVMESGIEAPLKKGQKVGEYRIYVADEKTGVVNLVVHEDVGTGWILSKIYISNLATVILIIIALLFLALLIRIHQVKVRRRKRREALRRQLIRKKALEELEMEEYRKTRNWTYKL